MLFFLAVTMKHSAINTIRYFMDYNSNFTYLVYLKRIYPNEERVYRGLNIKDLSQQQQFLTNCIIMQLARKQSQQKPKRLSFHEKLDLAKSFHKLIEFREPFSLINTLFGYALNATGIPPYDRAAFDLKEKFTSIQELLYERVISQDNAILIVLDAIETGQQQENQREKVHRFMNTLTFDLEETMINEHFIYQKWERQESAQQQLRKNEQALQKMLEEEKKANKMLAQQAESQGWECPVCCCEIDRNLFGILQCGHIFHNECINGYLKSKIEASQVEINCPMQGCPHKLQAADIYAHVDGDLKEKYQKFSFNKFVEMNHASTAWCPTAGCTAVFSFDEQLDNYKCPACSKHYCLRCKCEYHHGMTCAEYKINNSFDKNDEDFIKFVQGARYKQCPNCKFWVERHDGCSTMTCKCGQQFCYDCGGTTCPHGMCANTGRIPPVPVPVPRPRRLPGFFPGRKR